MAASLHRPPRLVYQSQHPSKGKPEWWFGDLAASPQRIALVRAWSDCEPAPYDQCGAVTDAAVGARGEKFHVLPRRDRGCDYEPASYHIDVDGDRVVYGGAFCAPGCGSCARIAIDDIIDATPPRIVVPKPEGVDDVRVAGSFVAARSVSWERVAVYELPLGKLVYKTRVPASAKIDLQADGTLVAVWWEQDGAVAAWFSPNEPRKHVIAIRPVLLHPYEDHALGIAVRIAKDRVAFERQLSPEKSELVIVDLAGKVVQRVASFDAKHTRVGDFDFDGELLTWAAQDVREVTKECWRISEAGHMACQDHYSGPTTIYLARLP